MKDQSVSSSRPRVLVVTASVGAGHRSAASAIVDSLRQQAGGIDVDCVDALDFTPRAFRAYYAGGFAVAMSKFPRLYGLGFRLTDRPSGPRRSLVERRRLWCERLCLRRIADYLRQVTPALVVNTHFLPAAAIGWMIRRGQIRTRQFVVVTDICVHRFWYSQNVEHWFVPSDESAEPLKRWGICKDNITVSGIPIHAKWTAPLDRAAILADWRLPSGRKIVTLSGGTEFTCGPVTAFARGLLDACPDMHLVVLIGRNEKLGRKLSSFHEAGDRMTIVPFTDRAHEILEVSSLMITKPGGITTAECLAKGTPMVLLSPVPGHEAGNASYLQRHGAAVIAPGDKHVAELVGRLLADEGELARISSSARRLYRPATQTIVNAICRAVS